MHANAIYFFFFIHCLVFVLVFCFSCSSCVSVYFERIIIERVSERKFSRITIFGFRLFLMCACVFIVCSWIRRHYRSYEHRNMILLPGFQHFLIENFKLFSVSFWHDWSEKLNDTLISQGLCLQTSVSFSPSGGLFENLILLLNIGRFW